MEQPQRRNIIMMRLKSRKGFIFRRYLFYTKQTRDAKEQIEIASFF